MSILFVVRALARLVGTFLAGYAFDRLAGHLVVILSFVGLIAVLLLTGSATQLLSVRLVTVCCYNLTLVYLPVLSTTLQKPWRAAAEGFIYPRD